MYDLWYFMVNFVVTTRLLYFATTEPAGKQEVGGSNSNLPNNHVLFLFFVISDKGRCMFRFHFILVCGCSLIN